MAVFGIEYRPQFIQSDIGAMQNKFNQLQQAYDQSYAGTLATEDQFNQLQVDPRDIALKNEIVGGFKNRVQEIVDRYGGDWGAASKALAKEVINTKSNQFFPLASRRYQLAEEQRKLASQPGSIIIKNINDINLRDKEGNWINPDQLDYQVTTRDYLEDQLKKLYAGRASKINELGYRAGPTGYKEKLTSEGLLEKEVAPTAQEMAQSLKEIYPNLDDNTIYDISFNTAKSMVGGTKSNLIEDKDWEVNEYNRRKSLENVQFNSPTNPFTSSYGAGNRNADKAIDKVNKEFNIFKNAADVYYNKNLSTKTTDEEIKTLKNNFTKFTYKSSSDIGAISNFIQNSTTGESGKVRNDILNMYASIYGTSDLVLDGNNNITGIKKDKLTKVSGDISNILSGNIVDISKRRFSNAIKPYENDPTYIDLRKHGMGPVQAASYVSNERRQMYMMHDRYDAPTDPEVTKLFVRDLRKNESGYHDVIDLENGKKVNSKDFSKDLIKGTEPIIEFNHIKKTAKITLNVDNKIKHYELPINNVQNLKISGISNAYNDFINKLYSPSVDTNGVESLNIGGGKLVYRSKFNNNTKRYDKVIGYERYNPLNGMFEQYLFTDDNEALREDPNIRPLAEGMDLIYDLGSTSLSDAYGLQPIYKQQKRGDGQ